MKRVWMYSRIGKTYEFSAAHYLDKVAEDHPCRRMHGHNYVVEVEVRGDTQPNGFCNGIDFYQIDALVKPLIAKLDHRTINDTIENPTAERIAQWFLDNLRQSYIYSITVWETPKCWATAVNDQGLYHAVHKE